MKMKLASTCRLLATAGLNLICAAACHAALLVDFEASENFIDGTSNTTVGQWVLPATASITSSAAYQGSQSLKLNGASITQWNPTTPQIAANYNLATFAMKTESFVANAQVGLWQVLYGGEKSESRVELRLYFGATADAPIKAEFLSTFSGAGAPTAYTTLYLSDINLLDWNLLSFGFDFSENHFQIKLADQTVALYEPLAALTTHPRIARLFLRGNAATVSYYDTVVLDHATVIPEPSAAALLILPAIGWPLLRRKKN